MERQPPPERVATTAARLDERDFSFLLEEVGALFELTPEQNIFEYISASLNRFLGSSVVLVNSFDETSNTLHMRAISGLGTRLDRVIGLLGSHPIDVSVTMNDAAREGLGFGTLKKVEDGIFGLAAGSIPEVVCRRIEDLLSVSGVYAMGITWHGKIIGSVAILARDEIQDPSIIETFIDFSAVALQRRLARETSGRPAS